MRHFNSHRIALGANAIGDGRNRRIHTQKEWHVSGDLGARGAATLRIYAPNKDAAITEAHARGMSVRECLPMKQKQK